jgi:hypothetical protein
MNPSLQDAVSPPKRAPVRRLLLAAAALLILLTWYLWPRHKPVVPPFDYVLAKAAQLGHDRARIVAYVQGLADGPGGVVRGPVGTLWAGAGSEEDRALLLWALLHASGEQARFATSAASGDSPAHTWVQVRDASAWVDLKAAGPAASPPQRNAADRTVEQIPPERFALLRIGVDGTGQPPGPTVELRMADLATQPITVAFKQTTWELIGARGTLLSGPVPPGNDAELTISFTARWPQGGGTYRDDPPVVREIFTRKYPEYRPTDDRRNRHTIVASTGVLPRWAFDKEIELIRAGQRPLPDEDSRANCILALSHMVESDRLLEELCQRFKTPATIAAPRLLIASTYHEGGDGDGDAGADGRGNGATHRALDLRSDRLSVQSADPVVRAAMGISRSVMEGALEGSVLRKATGSAVLSAFDVMRQACDAHRPSTPERLRLFTTALEKLLNETRADTTLTLATAGGQSVSFTHGDDRMLLMAPVAEPLGSKMRRSSVKWQALSPAGAKLKPEQIGLAALELEVLLGAVAEAPVDYRPSVQLDEPIQNLLATNARIYQMGWPEEGKPGRIVLEYQILQTSGDILYDSVDYWDEVNNRPYEFRSQFRVPSASVEGGDVVSYWYGQDRYDQGDLFLFFSRKMIRELREKGETIIRYRKYDNTLTEPIKLFLCDKVNLGTTINGRPAKLEVLYCAGDFVKDNPTRRPYGQTTPIVDTTSPSKDVINRWRVLNDPKFPLTAVSDCSFQTTIPGTVVSKPTGQGVPDATVTVEEPGVRGTTWGDGRFMLPILRQRFATFTVTANKPGYEPLRKSVDFTKPESFPIALELVPLAQRDDLIWVDADHVAQQGQRISSARIRDLVQREIGGRAGVWALVPTERVPYGGSTAQAFLVFDESDFSIVGVGEDGLHVSSDLTAGLLKDYAKHAWDAYQGKDPPPYAVQQDAINYYFGHVAAWYVYSGGRLDAVTEMMGGKRFDDLGHGLAMTEARQWIDSMGKALDHKLAEKAGVNREAFRAGFLAALKAFDESPEFNSTTPQPPLPHSSDDAAMRRPR